MTDVKDIIIASGGDLQFLGGDLLVSESDSMHVEHILTADKGQYRQHPLIGVGIFKYFHSPLSQQALKSDIKTQLTADGYQVNQTVINDDFSVDVDAQRKV